MRMCEDCLGSGSHAFIAPVNLETPEVEFSDTGFPVAAKTEPRSKLSWFSCVSCNGTGMVGAKAFAPREIQMHRPPKVWRKIKDKELAELGFNFPL